MKEGKELAYMHSIWHIGICSTRSALSNVSSDFHDCLMAVHVSSNLTLHEVTFIYVACLTVS